MRGRLEARRIAGSELRLRWRMIIMKGEERRVQKLGGAHPVGSLAGQMFSSNQVPHGLSPPLYHS